MKKIINFISITLFFCILLMSIEVKASESEKTNDIMLKYQSHIQNVGWENLKGNDEFAGTSGMSLRLEGIKITVESANKNIRVKYQTHVQNVGWQDYVYDGDQSGTTAKSLRLEGIRIQLVNAPVGYHIEYQTHVQNIGWQQYVRDGELSGTTGKSLRLEGIRIKIVKDTQTIAPTSEIAYSTHVQNIGWLSNVGDNIPSGRENSGLRIESIAINNVSLPSGASIRYKTHVQNIGWQDWVTGGSVAGTTGQGLRIEGFIIELIGAPTGTKILYQSYIQGSGWQVWKESGQHSGSEGQSLRIEAIRIKIVNEVVNLDSTKPVVKYQGYVNNTWSTTNVQEEQVIGTPGSGQPIKDFKFSVNPISNLKVTYQSYYEKTGWSNWFSDGNASGKQDDAIDGIRIKLEGDTKNFHVLYKVYTKNIGWQNWSKDGEISGFIGKNNSIEAVSIKIVQSDNAASLTKGRIAIDIGHNAAYDSGATGIVQEDVLTKEVGLLVIKKLRDLGYNVIDVLPTNATSVSNSLIQRVECSNINEADKFISIHFNKFNGDAYGSEVYYYTENGKELAQNVLSNLVNLGFYNRGVKTANFYVIKNTTAPAILIEGCFIDNVGDMNLYNSDKISTAIVNGITK